MTFAAGVITGVLASIGALAVFAGITVWQLFQPEDRYDKRVRK